MQPVNHAAKIGTNDKNHTSSNHNFNKVYQSVIEKNAKVTKQVESTREKGLVDKVNYYGMDAKAAYYYMSSSQNNYYT